MSHKQDYEARDVEYGTDNNFRSFERIENGQRRRPAPGHRRGKAPTSFNGMHRRRRRKMAW